MNERRFRGKHNLPTIAGIASFHFGGVVEARLACFPHKKLRLKSIQLSIQLVSQHDVKK